MCSNSCMAVCGAESGSCDRSGPEAPQVCAPKSYKPNPQTLNGLRNCERLTFCAAAAAKKSSKLAPVVKVVKNTTISSVGSQLMIFS